METDALIKKLQGLRKCVTGIISQLVSGDEIDNSTGSQQVCQYLDEAGKLLTNVDKILRGEEIGGDTVSEEGITNGPCCSCGKINGSGRRKEDSTVISGGIDSKKENDGAGFQSDRLSAGNDCQNRPNSFSTRDDVKWSGIKLDDGNGRNISNSKQESQLGVYYEQIIRAVTCACNYCS